MFPRGKSEVGFILALVLIVAVAGGVLQTCGLIPPPREYGRAKGDRG